MSGSLIEYLKRYATAFLPYGVLSFGCDAFAACGFQLDRRE